MTSAPPSTPAAAAPVLLATPTSAAPLAAGRPFANATTTAAASGSEFVTPKFKGCVKHPVKALLGCFVPCFANAQARMYFDDSNWLFNCCCVPPCAVYNFVREGYGIRGSCGQDLLFTWFCPGCAIAQMWVETERRGKVYGTRAKLAAPVQDWRTPMFNCESPATWLFACFCPHCSQAVTRNQYDSSNVWFNCCALTTVVTRNLIREGYNIKGSIVHDILMSCLCLPCALHQIHMEVRKRGAMGKAAVGGPAPVTMY